MQLTKQILLDSGWQHSKQIDHVYQRGIQIQSEKNIHDISYLIKLLKREFPDSYACLPLRENPVPCREAILPTTPLEQINLSKAKNQIKEILHSPVVEAAALMPDACPVGSSKTAAPVGAAIITNNAIIPAAHSSDICCSLLASFYQSNLSLAEELDALTKSTRFGPGGREKSDLIKDSVIEEPVWSNPFLKGLQTKARIHMADQGDGNHFAFLGTCHVDSNLLTQLRSNDYEELAKQLETHKQWKVIITHHGSRGLGHQLYQRGIEAAIKATNLIAKNIPEEAAWLDYETNQGRDYWNALQYVSQWTKANHRSIHRRFSSQINSEMVAEIGNEHNFVWKRGDNFYHGKGATPAWNKESGGALLGLIPMNMKEPVLLTLGSNNEKFLSFSPHGAGRNMSRTQSLKRYNKGKKFNQALLNEDLQTGTEGLDVRWYRGLPDITETPIAYKSAQTVREQIKHFELATVITEIHPRGCIMAGRSPKHEKPLSPKQLRQMQHRSARRKSHQRNWEEEL